MEDNDQSLILAPKPPELIQNNAQDRLFRICAHFDALRVPPSTIEQIAQLQPGEFSVIRQNYEYRFHLREAIRTVASEVVSAFEHDPVALADSQVINSMQTLIEVRDNPTEKGATRVKAAAEFLDRAPSAPKARKEIDERQIIINIPVTQHQNMIQALEEEGAEEDVKLIEFLSRSKEGNNQDESIIEYERF